MGTLTRHVAEEVRVLLARRRMSAAALARKLGVSQTYIWRRLEGQTAFDLTDLERIAEILDVEVTELLPRAVPAAKALNFPLITPVRTATATSTERAGMHRATRPIGSTRRPPTRPQSPIPATKRRPTPTGPLRQPIPA